jgi:hypothetical protein
MSTSTPAELSTPDKVVDGGDGVEYELVGEGGEVLMRTNRDTIDDPGRQGMSMDEIEALKRKGQVLAKISLQEYCFLTRHWIRRPHFRWQSIRCGRRRSTCEGSRYCN